MKRNLDRFLRVRLTPTEDARVQAAATRLGLSRSVYVRWALENSSAQVLGPSALRQLKLPRAQRRAPDGTPQWSLHDDDDWT